MDINSGRTHDVDITPDPVVRRETTIPADGVDHDRSSGHPSKAATMIRTSEIETLLCVGGTVVDPSGRKIGDIKQIFLDDDTGRAEWVTVSTGRFGGAECLVPLLEGIVDGTRIQVPYDRSKVKRAGLIIACAGPPTRVEASRLYAFYGCTGTSAESSSSRIRGRAESP
jgi:sporulation protein YlmC with PRC-barrel domain